MEGAVWRGAWRRACVEEWGGGEMGMSLNLSYLWRSAENIS